MTEFLRDAAARAATDPIRVSVRDLLAHWDAKRRGYWIVEAITRDLTASGLTTEPPFTEVWIDSKVKLVPLPGRTATGADRTSDATPAPEAAAPAVIGLRVDSLKSANADVKFVRPDDSLEKAQSLMMRYDYSQLAVMSGVRDLRGAISWESIARARIRNPAATLKDAKVPAETLRSEDDLLAKIPVIQNAGYAFVIAADNRVSGVVTPYDLSEQFANLATPFFLLAEIERRLRRIIDRAFTPEDLESIRNPDDAGRTVQSAHDLTIGEYRRLLENPSHWQRLGWALDRSTFIDALEDVREIRNDVMHFNPDPLDASQLETLNLFIKWVRSLDEEGSRADA